MNFKQYVTENNVLNNPSLTPTTIKPRPVTTTDPQINPQGVKPGSIRDSEKFYNDKPVKIIAKEPDSVELIWVMMDTEDEQGKEIQVKIDDLTSAPYNNNSPLPPVNTKTVGESKESKPEDILKNAFSYLTKNEHKLKEKSDIEMFNKVKEIMSVYKKTKHLSTQDIDFLTKEVKPLFEELLLGDEEGKEKVEENWRPGRHNHNHEIWVGKDLDDAGWRKGTWNPSNTVWRYEGKLKDNDELLHDDDQDGVLLKKVSTLNRETFITVHDPVDEQSKRAFDKYVLKNYKLRNT